MSSQGIPQRSFDRTQARAASARLASGNAPSATTPALNQRTVLVKIDSVIDVRGVSAEAAYALADGKLVFVWNVAVNLKGKIRVLRFFAREVVAPKMTRGLGIDHVIEIILGDRKIFHAGDVCQLLRVRRPTLLALRKQLGGRLQRCGGAIFQRDGIQNFLQTRWLGRVITR